MVAFRLIRLLGVMLLLLAAIIALPTAVAREASSPMLRAITTTSSLVNAEAPQPSVDSSYQATIQLGQPVVRDMSATPRAYGEGEDALLLIALAAMLALAGEIVLRTVAELRRL